MVIFYSCLAACWLVCGVLNTITYTRNDEGIYLFLVFLNAFLFVCYTALAISKAVE
jgi:hypothetical protein